MLGHWQALMSGACMQRWAGQQVVPVCLCLNSRKSNMRQVHLVLV